MAIIKCPECGHQVSDKAATCPSCGVKISGNVMECPECGAVVFKDQALCPDCHCPLQGNASAKEPSPGSQTGMDGLNGASRLRVPAEDTTSEQLPPISDGGEKGAPTGGNSHKKVYMSIVVTVVVVLIVGFVGMYFYNKSQSNGELEAYETAMGSSEPAVLQNFLDLYKDAPAEHRDSIQAHLDLLLQADREWTNIVLSGSKTAIERYLQMHPESPHAKEAKIKIDSLDWVAASKANTPDAYQAYIDAHSDGLYIDQAKNGLDKASALQVTALDKQNMSQIFESYFNALAGNDVDALTSTIANVMDNFLHKANATKNDVVSYMRKLHSETGDGALEFRTNNDWKIEKSEMADGSGYEYTVTFSVDQKTPGKDGGESSIVTYKVEAKVSSDSKITTLNMKRMVQ
jgi:hypothetical protein